MEHQECAPTFWQAMFSHSPLDQSIEYCFYPIDDPNDKSCIMVTYHGAATEIIDNENEFTMDEFYPNPAKDYFILRTPENAINKNLILTIYNLAGQVVLSEKIEASNQFIDVSKLHSAYYIYEISGIGIRTARNKLIVLPD